MKSLAEVVREILEERFYFVERLAALDWTTLDRTSSIPDIARLVEQLNEPFTHLFTLEEGRLKYGLWKEKDSEVGVYLLNEGYQGKPLSSSDGYPILRRVYLDGPAWQAGLRPSDVLLSVDGASMQAIDLIACRNALRGPENSEVTLVVRQRGEETSKQFIVRRRSMKIPGAYGHGIDCWSYLKMDHFLLETHVQLRELDDYWLPTRKGTIIDLRENGGGTDKELLAVAYLLLPEGRPVGQMAFRAEGQLLYWLDRTNRRGLTKRIMNRAGSKSLVLPTVVLIDRYTASAGEVLADALRNNGAYLIGEPTFGKGVQQAVKELPDYGAMLALTHAKCYTLSGEWIGDGSGREPGLQPDLIAHRDIRIPPGSEGDTQLEAAIRYLETVG